MENQLSEVLEQILSKITGLEEQHTLLTEKVENQQAHQPRANVSSEQINAFFSNFETFTQNWDNVLEYQRKLQKTLEGVQDMYNQLGRVLQQDATFEMEIRRLTQSNESSGSALHNLVECVTEHQDSFRRLAKDLSNSITTVDKSTLSFLEERKKQFQNIFDITLEQLDHFFQLEQEVFLKGMENAKKIIDQQNLIHPLEHLKYLPLIYELLEQKIGAAKGVGDQLPQETFAAKHSKKAYDLLYAEASAGGVFTKVSAYQNNKAHFVLKTSDGVHAQFQVIVEKATSAIRKQEYILQETCTYENDFYREGNEMLPKTKLKNLEEGEVVYKQGEWNIIKKAVIEFYD